jgi:hypothetical protein
MTVGTASTKVKRQEARRLSGKRWFFIGITTGVAAAAVVLIVQFIALGLFPEAAAFKPLESYPRSAVFTLVPALVATGLFARLVHSRDNPVGIFLKIAIAVLLISFVPDYLLRDPNKTFLASSIAAFLHVIATFVITTGIIFGYKKSIR